MAHAEIVTKSLYSTAAGHDKRREQVAVYEPSVSRPDADNRNLTDAVMDENDTGPIGTSAASVGTDSAASLVHNSNQIDSIFPIYRLELVAVHYNGTLLDQLSLSLAALEHRVSQLEHRIQEHLRQDQLAPIQDLQDLRHRVDQLKESLDSVRHLTPAGGGSDRHDPKEEPGSETTAFRPALGRPYWNRHKGRRRSVTEKRLVCQRFLQICELKLTEEIRRCLRMPTFDNWQWEDEEILLLLQQMYVDLNLAGPGGKFPIEMAALRKFLCQVYMNYNEVPFHNFNHCFCVSQMMYGIIWYLELPEKLGDLETLILLTSCICHDLDHPGFNNIYQINARTELALRYNDISPLENHHCSVAFNILEDPTANIFRQLDRETFKCVREGMIRCILATDMARHNEILNQFNQIITVFDYENRAHVNLLCMVLIKVADISNEARPMDVAEPWLDCLLQEFYEQSDAEKLLGLPVTPFMDRDKITKPSSQCSFIGFVLLPLFETIERLFPQLKSLIVDPVREALEYYRQLNEASKDNRTRRSLDPVTSPVPTVTPAPTPTDADAAAPTERTASAEDVSAVGGHPPAAPALSQQMGNSFEERSRTPLISSSPASNERFPRMLSTEEELRRLSLGLDLETSTETEVDVSEKTFTFKIATDTAASSNHLHAAGAAAGGNSAFRRASLAFLPSTGSLDSTLGHGRNVSAKGNRPATAVSQPSSPRYIRASILEEADEEEAPNLHLEVQMPTAGTSQPRPVVQTPSPPVTPAPMPASPPPPPPNGRCPEGVRLLEKNEPAAENRSRLPVRENPILLRLRHWTDRLKATGSADRSRANSVRNENDADAAGSKSPRLTSRRLSLSLSRLFGRSLSRSKQSRRDPADIDLAEAKSASAASTPPVTRQSDHLAKMSSSLDSLVVQINSSPTG